MTTINSCDYCGKTYTGQKLTPLFEKGKDYIRLYCDRCLPEVKSNIQSLPWNDLYSWGKKGW